MVTDFSARGVKTRNEVVYSVNPIGSNTRAAEFAPLLKNCRSGGAWCEPP